MNWRSEETHCVDAQPDPDSEIKTGDLVYLDRWLARPMAAYSNPSEAFAEFLGVAMQPSPRGSKAKIRVATTGVFELKCEVTRDVWLGERAYPTELNSQMVKLNGFYAIGRVAKYGKVGDKTLYISIRSRIMGYNIE